MSASEEPTTDTTTRESLPISYESEEVGPWDTLEPNRRVNIRERTWQIKGAANRILKDKLYIINNQGKVEKVKLDDDIFRETEAKKSLRLNLRTTTKADDKEFRKEVLAEVQRVINQGPQNPAYIDEDKNGEGRREAYNMGADGAIIRALKLLPPHINDPDMAKLPDDFFREGDSKEFREQVLNGLKGALQAAKDDHLASLDAAVVAINEHIQSDPTINNLREELGEDVFDLTTLFQWNVQMRKGDVPTRITQENLFYIYDEAHKLAESMYDDITKPEKAAEIENGFKEALLDAPKNIEEIEERPAHIVAKHEKHEEILKSLKKEGKDEARIAQLKKELNELRNELLREGVYKLKGIKGEEACEELCSLEGVDFVKALYKKMGIHLGFQGLESNRELIPVAKEYEDLGDIFRYLMGWDNKTTVAQSPTDTRSLWNRKQERRTKDYIQPSVLLAYDEEFFVGMDSEEQIERLELLQLMLGEDYIDSLGVIKVMELAGRTATLDGKGPDGRKKAKKLCGRVMRIALGLTHADAEHYIIMYDDSNGFNKRQIWFSPDMNKPEYANVGLALGRVVQIESRSPEPLGGKE